MNAALAVQVLLGLLDHTQEIGVLLSTAQAEGRDITEEELDSVVALDNAARETLKAAIEKARSG